ncbi:DNA mismatch repair protein MLH1 [Acorus calamus]|uniref:DNA mismatch repair protein MLH1 n=1 Tax=Acorus calamus TaxID=4465 RepID=A0AAV9DF66_ACOCL|nr:DNA mismatch repair protein MLH1 [Acorus calamus]
MSPPPSPPRVAREPPVIRRLNEAVVNRIAAGEVVQRPSAAVKELVENSLDAGSTSVSVSVSVKDGGLKLILVSDNGHGIRYEDLPILCERHTTSKLSAFEDLQTIKSMGFRGEALASMTYVGHVTVMTITEGQLHGYRVSYKDGVMENDPKPCAAVENLFYNMIARRKTLLNSNDDYSKIVDLVSRFAIHHINVSFSCRKCALGKECFHMAPAELMFTQMLHVQGWMLLDLSMMNDPSRSVFKMDGYISNANYISKKTTMVLFINDRLVECNALKRAIEVVYAATLPKASKPFVYMSIALPPEHVDVNMHPTKREVSLLNQESLVETIQSAVETMLMNCNTTRTFGTQGQNHRKFLSIKWSGRIPWTQLEGCTYLPDKPQGENEKQSNLAAARISVRQRRNPKESADLTSIHQLLDDIECNTHSGLLETVKHCTYVGMADDTFALLQHNTRLYLANVVKLSKELMYQQVIRQFVHFNAIQLSNPAPLSELIIMALKDEDLESGSTEDDDLKEKIAEMNTELLMQKAEMLLEYFCIQIDEQGNLLRLPVILDQYTPDMDHLPEFMLSLGNDVDWEDEKECLQTISAALGNFYAMHPPIIPNPSGDGIEYYKKNREKSNDTDIKMLDDNNNEGNCELEQELLAEAETAWAQREWTIQHVLFPSMRLFLKPPKSMATNGTFVQVVSLEKLYKIFERC